MLIEYLFKKYDKNFIVKSTFFKVINSPYIKLYYPDDELQYQHYIIASREEIISFITEKKPLVEIVRSAKKHYE